VVLILPAVAITASSLLRAELRACGQHAGRHIEYVESIQDGRKYARRRPMVIIGADLVARVRKPIHCGLLVVATVGPCGGQTFGHASRVGAAYVIDLPSARAWLVDQLLHVTWP
jgi:hypothetical protein